MGVAEQVDHVALGMSAPFRAEDVLAHTTLERKQVAARLDRLGKKGDLDKLENGRYVTNARSPEGVEHALKYLQIDAEHRDGMVRTINGIVQDALIRPLLEGIGPVVKALERLANELESHESQARIPDAIRRIQDTLAQYRR